MELVDRKTELEITEKSLNDDCEIENACIHNVSVEFVAEFVLERQGDYCISKGVDNHFYLSIYPSNRLNPKEKLSVVHFRLDVEDDKLFGIKGMLFASSKSLGALVYELKSTFNDLLGGVAKKNLVMKRLMGLDGVEKHNVFVKKSISEKNVLAQSYGSLIYTAELKMADGEKKKVMLEEKKNVQDEQDFWKAFYENLCGIDRNIAKTLPIRMPIGAILSPPTLIYEFKDNEVGMTLDYILKYHDRQLDLAQKIKLCSSAVRIMSELHQAGIFHGALQAEHFFAEFRGIKDGLRNYRLVFNGASGLLVDGKSDTTVGMIDYDTCAPELAFTRKLTKESGAFNMGRLFEQILKTEIRKTYEKSSEEEPRALRSLRRLIARATRPNPQKRPTMHGIVMMIREVLIALPRSTAPINFLHYQMILDD